MAKAKKLAEELETELTESAENEAIETAPKRRKKPATDIKEIINADDVLVVSNTKPVKTAVKKPAKKAPVKKEKGPKTVFIEEIIEAKHETLNFTEEKVEVKSFDIKDQVKKKEEIVVERFNPDVSIGLSTEQYEARVMAGLANTGNTGSTKTVGGIILSNVVTFFNLLNFLIAAWIISSGAHIKNLAFLFVVTANITIGIIQEIRSKRTIDKLSLLSAPTALVVRDEIEVEVAVSDVVIDDILRLSAGRQIPTDAVVRSGQVEVNESLLTGESDAIVKKVGDPLYSGSFVISGSCYAQTVAVGKDIYIEKLSDQARKYRKPKSELLGSLKLLIRIIGVLILPIAGVLFYMMAQNNNITEMSGEVYRQAVLSTTGAMIGMIPSGLFLLTSMALAVGVIRLAQNNTLVQELYCIEMLARVDMLCLDKTGTITDGTMSVHSVIEFKNETGLTLKNIISAMLNAEDDHNLTSRALMERFGTAKKIRFSNHISFSSQRKFSAVQFDRYGTFVLGAPEFVIKDENYDAILGEVNKQAAAGYRVLVVAHSKGKIVDQRVDGKLNAIALIMIEDTIRPDAIETIEYFKQHGVGIKVISGDNPMTVSRISQRAGIQGADKYISLEGATDKDVVRYAAQYTVFGRVNPNQKKILIQALKNEGHTVAMTGDGVNDILALKEADTSIAMASGSEAARNVAHLVLLDSNFSSMPKVVAEGRRVINNVQRVSTLFLTKTIFSLLLAIMAIIRKGEYPIQPVQLALIDYLVIGVPSFFLALEPNNKQVKGKFLWNIIRSSLPGALVVLINSLIIFALAPALNMDSAVTSTLIVITATVTCLMVLLRVSLPFNTMRKVLFLTMCTLFVLAVLFIPNYLEFVPFFKLSIMPNSPILDTGQILLILVLAQATYPMMYIVANIYGWITSFIKHLIKKITELQ